MMWCKLPANIVILGYLKQESSFQIYACVLNSTLNFFCPWVISGSQSKQNNLKANSCTISQILHSAAKNSIKALENVH